MAVFRFKDAIKCCISMGAAHFKRENARIGMNLRAQDLTITVL
jgi:hypothetical protein